MRVRISRAARADLSEIAAFLKTIDAGLARRTIAALKQRAKSLADHPRRGVVLRQTDVGELRRLVVDPYLLFYEVAPAEVLIVRVVHGARDPNTHLDHRSTKPPDDAE